MVKQYDHELNTTGISQARTFNETWHQASDDEPRLQEFLAAGAIYASPLTRATQTALLTCQDHPFFAKGGPLVLLRQNREVKTTPMGSLDTVGQYSGDDIPGHVAMCLEKDGASLEGLDVPKVMAPSIDTYDSVGAWWTPLNEHDG